MSRRRSSARWHPGPATRLWWVGRWHCRRSSKAGRAGRRCRRRGWGRWIRRARVGTPMVQWSGRSTAPRRWPAPKMWPGRCTVSSSPCAGRCNRAHIGLDAGAPTGPRCHHARPMWAGWQGHLFEGHSRSSSGQFADEARRPTRPAKPGWRRRGTGSRPQARRGRESPRRRPARAKPRRAGQEAIRGRVTGQAQPS